MVKSERSPKILEKLQFISDREERTEQSQEHLRRFTKIAGKLSPLEMDKDKEVSSLYDTTVRSFPDISLNLS